LLSARGGNCTSTTDREISGSDSANLCRNSITTPRSSTAKTTNQSGLGWCHSISENAYSTQTHTHSTNTTQTTSNTHSTNNNYNKHNPKPHYQTQKTLTQLSPTSPPYFHIPQSPITPFKTPHSTTITITQQTQENITHNPRWVCNNSNPLKILHWNAQGLRPKIATLQSIISKEKVDIILLQETLIPASNNISFSGYIIVNSPYIPNNNQRGCMILIKNNRG